MRTFVCIERTPQVCKCAQGGLLRGSFLSLSSRGVGSHLNAGASRRLPKLASQTGKRVGNQFFSSLPCLSVHTSLGKPFHLTFLSTVFFTQKIDPKGIHTNGFTLIFLFFVFFFWGRGAYLKVNIALLCRFSQLFVHVHRSVYAKPFGLPCWQRIRSARSHQRTESTSPSSSTHVASVFSPLEKKVN